MATDATDPGTGPGADPGTGPGADPGTGPGADAGSELSYEAAIAELERIVTDLQNDEVGVDELASRVARGARLVELCRERLRRAELAVDEVVEALRTAGEQDATGDGPPSASVRPSVDERPEPDDDVLF